MTLGVSQKHLLGKLKNFPWEEWDASLSRGLAQPYRDLIIKAGSAAAQSVGADFNVVDPFLSRFMTEYVLERATQLNATTHARVADVIRSSFAKGGDDIGQLVLDTVRETFDGYEVWRAELIARTESAIGYNNANVLGFSQAGVEEVDVVDGTGDAICEEANGQVWTLREALMDPIGHPNCTRGFIPRLPDAQSSPPFEWLMLDEDLPLVCAVAAEYILALEDPCRDRILDEIDED